MVKSIHAALGRARAKAMYGGADVNARGPSAPCALGQGESQAPGTAANIERASILGRPCKIGKSAGKQPRPPAEKSFISRTVVGAVSRGAFIDHNAPP
jgi:hypothetical protein